MGHVVGYDGRRDGFQVLDASHSHLVSLVTGPESPLWDVVRSVTTLCAPSNEIASLAGLDAFLCLEVLNLAHNALHVLDAQGASILRRLPHLQRVDLSYNRLKFIDLETPLSTSKSSGTPALRKDVPLTLTDFNLSHNALMELPDLRSLPTLRVLLLNHNAIEDVSDLDSKLPLVALHTLQLSSNKLSTASSIMPLTALAGTLRHLQVYGNPFTLDDIEVAMSPGQHSCRSSIIYTTHNQWWWRPYVLWLVPHLQTLDGADFTVSERQVTTQLFRDRGTLSRDRIELLNPQRRDDLESYLRRMGDRATAPADIGDIVTATAAEEQHLRGCDAFAEPQPRVVIEDRYRSQHSSHGRPTTNGWARRVPSISSQEAGEPFAKSPSERPFMMSKSAHRTSVTPTCHGSASVVAILRALQGKVKSIAAVTEQLWARDVSDRTQAAIVIQKYFRSALVRKHLSEEERETLRAIRLQLRQLSSPAYLVQSAVAAAWNGVNIYQLLTMMCELKAIVTANAEQYRAMSVREQRRAAVTIQRHFRGYMARLQTRPLRRSYEEYVETLVPVLIILQRAGRGYLARRYGTVRLVNAGEVRRLRREMAVLRAEVANMKATMHQFLRRPSADNPQDAMDAIVDKYVRRQQQHHHTIPAVEEIPDLLDVERDSSGAVIDADLTVEGGRRGSLRDEPSAGGTLGERTDRRRIVKQHQRQSA